MRKQYFSLIELLVVIAIIAILMGILIPAVSNMTEKARVTKALTEMNSIKNAIKQYEATYGLLPIPAGTDFTRYDNDTATDYDKLMEWLTQTDCTGDGNVDSTGNLRKIKFLDPPTAKSGTDNRYYDPWSKSPDTYRRYVIIIDDNYDGHVEAPYDSSKTLNGSVFLYSYGPNRDDNKGLNRANGGGSGTDDVNSWDK